MIDVGDLRRTVRDRAVRVAAAAGDRVGVAVVPRHFYGSVASRRHLRDTTSWRRPFVPAGLDWDLDAQSTWLRAAMADENLMTADDRAALDRLGRVGSGFGLAESEVLFGFLKANRPGRIIEIGSGHTTAIMRQALIGTDVNLTAIDPYSSLPEEIRSDVEVVQKPLQDVTDDIVSDLGDGDLLFIDSSHAVKTGSEVHLIYLDLLPRLAAGVHVHVHDIYLPYVHHPAILAEDLWDWQETALLVALLANSTKFEIDCALSALAHDRPDVLRQTIPGYEERPTDAGGLFIDKAGHFPASLWMHSR